MTNKPYQRLSLIAAMASNRVIGKDNKMPWHHSADLRYFKKVTMGKPVVMGRKTFESIGKPLPGRHNIILTRDTAFKATDCTVVHSLEEAVQAAGNCEELMVIGGSELYNAFLPLADCVYLTVINSDFEGDAYFPVLCSKDWNEVKRQDCPSDERVPYTYSFVTLERKA